MASDTPNARIDIQPLDDAERALRSDMIGVFNSGLVPLSRYRRDFEFFQRVKPEHLRVDLAWGWGSDLTPEAEAVVTRSADGFNYHFGQTDDLAHLLRSAGVAPYWSYCYVPEAFRSAGQDWKTFPDDITPWVELVAAYAKHAKDTGVQIGYHEVYNEPDLRDERNSEPIFYSGDLTSYLDLYEATAVALREVDPDARIGGPSLAMLSENEHWMPAFLDRVAERSLPLDFISFHHYGHQSVARNLSAMSVLLAQRPELSGVELHLNEFNSFPIDYPQGGLQDGYLMASAFMRDVARFLSTPRLTRVSWAQFLDSGFGNFSGMVTIDGEAKPIFYAYEFLRNMPANEAQVEVSGPDGVGALASTDDTSLDVAIWNRSISDLSITIPVTGTIDGELTLIDSRHTGEVHEQCPRSANGYEIKLERGAMATIHARRN